MNRFLVALLLGGSLVLAACGGGGEGPAASPASPAKEAPAGAEATVATPASTVPDGAGRAAEARPVVVFVHAEH